MRPRLFLATMLLSLAFVHPTIAGEPNLTLDVWPGKAPGETGSISAEKVVEQKPGDKPIKILTNISHPTLSVFRPRAIRTVARPW